MIDLDADAHQYRLDEIKELQTEIKRLSECLKEANKKIELFEREYYLAKDRTEQLEASMRNILDAWDFWQRQECRNGFSELCVSIWDARALLEKKDDAR